MWAIMHDLYNLCQASYSYLMSFYLFTSKKLSNAKDYIGELKLQHQESLKQFQMKQADDILKKHAKLKQASDLVDGMHEYNDQVA